MGGKKVLVAMSGGVDSSVSALLLKQQGYECVGATMRLYDDRYQDGRNGVTGPEEAHALNAKDIADARKVCEHIGIEHHVYNLGDDFERYVVGPFVDAYERGDIPNPCVICNKHLKFGALLAKGYELGCDYIATGHYALVQRGPDGLWTLSRGKDLSKDQSYVLYNLTQEILDHVIFPLGTYEKPHVRQIAAEHGLPVTFKGESQDICFIPDGNWKRFLELQRGGPHEPGDILDRDGNVVGRHAGAALYTIGQRKGLGVAMGHPVYVCAKDMAANTVTIGERENLLSRGCLASSWNWIGRTPEVGEEVRVQVKTNYKQTPHGATVSVREDGTVQVMFDEPCVRAARGQSAVVYDGDVLLGGGIIQSSID